MRKLLFIILLSLSSCASFQISTLNHDPIYTLEGSDVNIRVINNEFELNHLLRNDFNFRYNFAQYAQTLPITWHYSNRFMGFNRYNRFNNYSSFYYSYSNRHQMWNDWVWGYPYGNGIGWSYSWNNNRWSSNSWNNPYGWNNYNRYRGTNVAYHTNRRGRTTNTNNRRVIKQRITTVNPPRKIVTPKPRRVIRNNNIPTIRTKPVRRTRTVIPSVRVNTPTRTTTRPLNNTQPTRRINSRRKN
jgi:hypothetical protein